MECIPSSVAGHMNSGLWPSYLLQCEHAALRPDSSHQQVAMPELQPFLHNHMCLSLVVAEGLRHMQ